MLGWVLRRGPDARKAPYGGGDDTTQLEQPDTPAPVFAARALKTAIFGEPDRANDDATITTQNPGDTPTKPTGILLTPGTGTTRRKRVSFGRDVLQPGPQADEKGTAASRNISTHRRTKLTELMENSRRDKAKASATISDKKQPAPSAHQEQVDEDEWEEEEDEEDFCTHDITVDLNEPYSRSGKYWKSNFETYHQDAKAEMEKLLKYKQLAKSYAKMKDAEASDLHEKLREEQAKVGEMERKLGEMTTQIASRTLQGGGPESPELMRDLAKQTALAVQYRSQVKELEALIRDRTSDQDPKGRYRRTVPSPRGNKALLEAQRELRRAKVQLQSMESLRDEVDRLKSELKTAEQRSSKRAGRGGDDESTYVKDLLAQLREAKAESRRTDEQLKRLADDYEKFRSEAVAQQADAKRVLGKTTEKISELKRELRTLRPTVDERGPRPRSFHGTSTTAPENRRDLGGDERPDIHVDLRDLARLTNSASPHSHQSGERNDVETNTDGRRVKPSQPSRTLRDKFLEDTVDMEAQPVPAPPFRSIMEGRANLERPKWQPYIPRSPRNRAYFMKDLGRRRGNGGLDDDEPENQIGPRDAGAERISWETRVEIDQEDEPRVDLLRDRFKHLGLPDVNNSGIMSANNSRCPLPPDRRAAALARIEQRKAERRKAGANPKGRDKENVRPGANRVI
ncbi:uncharacterized protein DNG_01150 [Cephalotrichum gorgonifer]|uniref:Spindle pole body-associated protein cut12 domain-containing protein n=1 Tax=Cephalotrichum gorgonifer TaxID=2041049 RepID=A0AAE8MS36_9PEZI|nr:uncharacterized protein DNG_01150 [Cephalotrichum gorgonifer]